MDYIEVKPFAMRYFLCVLFVSFVSVSVLGKEASGDVGSGYKLHQFSDTVMGTSVSMQFYCDSAVKAQSVFVNTMTELRRVEQMMSPYIEGSDLYRINQLAQTQAVVVDPELVYVIEQSKHYSRLSDGAFDISFASVGFLYDFKAKSKPSLPEQDAARGFINFYKIKLDRGNSSISLQGAGMQLDLGGIAKGYAIDQVINGWRRVGIISGLISVGGDTRVVGSKGQSLKSSQRSSEPWLLGIRNPRGKGHVITLPVTDVAVSTSGDYERFFIAGGERYHHILNPRNGESAHAVMSVTILADTSLAADALSTAVFVMGPQSGLALIETMDKVSAVIIDAQGRVLYSSDLIDPLKQ